MRGGNPWKPSARTHASHLAIFWLQLISRRFRKTALPYATALAGQYEAKIVVAHAISPEPRLSRADGSVFPVEADPAWLEAEGKLAEFALGNSLGA